MKHKETLGAGSIQYMSAGTGVLHSEFNDEDVPCRFIQVIFNLFSFSKHCFFVFLFF